LTDRKERPIVDAKDLSALIKWAESQGWEVKIDTKGYRRFYDPEGNYVANYPATPGKAWRRMKELQLALKRAGLQIPPPSRREQRELRRRDG
jgi:hypothetical protein